MNAARASEIEQRATFGQFVREEQLRVTYRNARTGIVVNVVNGLITVALLWPEAPPSFLAIWTTVLIGVTGLRAWLVYMQRRGPARYAALPRWGVLFTLGAAGAGMTWAALGVMAILYLPLHYQVFVAFVIGGMALGALAVSGAFLPAYLTFLFSAVLPIVLALLLQGQGTSLAMGALGAVFVGALYVLGRNLSATIAKSIQLSVERANLIHTLRLANEEVTRSNRRLKAEIEERQRVEAALREREATYRAMFEKNRAVKLMVDPETGAIVDANPAASELYGYSLAQLRAKNISEISILPREKVLQEMASAMDERQLRFEGRHRLASGEVRDVEVHCGPIDFHGRALHFSIIHDITERKQAETALRKAHEELEIEVQERADEAMFANSQLWREIRERKRVEQSLRKLHEITAAQGLSFEDKVVALLTAGCALLDLPIGILSRVDRGRYEIIDAFTPNESPKAGAVFAFSKTYCRVVLNANGPHVFSRPRASALEEHPCYKGRRLEAYLGLTVLVGGEVYGTLDFLSFEPRGRQFTPADEEILRLMGQWVGGDIARQHIERALQESEERYRNLVESTSDWVWELDEEGRYRYCSPRSRDLLGYEPDELIGRSPFDLMPSAEARRVRKSLADTLHDRKPFVSLENENLHKNGTRVVLETSGVPIFSTAGRFLGYRGIDRDITERKRAEEALFREKERAQVTLHSIGDAVITTDADRLVEYLNPTAKVLTGWSMHEARRQPLKSVLALIDEQNRAPVEDPAARCLADSGIVRIPDQCVLVNRSGREYVIQGSAAPIRGRMDEDSGVVVVFKDITEARRMARELARQATHDSLTGLVNRREFERRLGHALASAKTQGTQHALCYLDLDQFKLVNDTAGHAAGDMLLKQVASLLMDRIRARDTLARLGGDEFSLLVENCPFDKALEISEALASTVRDFRFVWKNRSFQLGISIGVVAITAASENTTQLLTQADVACYTAKDLGRNRVYPYHAQNGELTRRHMEIHRAADLRGALEAGQFRLYCQPIVTLPLGRNTVIYHEVLLRLLDAKGEVVAPRAFIPAAERYGLMGALDRWVIRTALSYAAGTEGNARNVALAINLSGHSRNDDTLTKFVRRQLAEYAFPPQRVCFEITETAAVTNLTHTIHLITEMKETGIRFALDDFGSGLCSFTYLKHLPVDYLKIDGSFVHNMVDNAVDHAIVAAINQVGHIMGIRTIAEYVESNAIAAQLERLGVDYAQGYAVGSPKPLI
jgi:diguanylate cyclase (GGDEF)-like protein/PAS domain S-box-containing protein